MGVTAPQDKWLKVNGLKLHYLDWGNHLGQPVLLLHGFLGQAHVWDEFAVKISQTYHVLALDQRGHGQSQHAGEETYGLDDHFADLSGFIELLELKNLILIGHSMGGRNALFYTACRPECVDKLILVDARPAESSRSTSALKDILNRSRPCYNNLEELVVEARAAYPYLAAETCRKLVAHAFRETADHRLIPTYDEMMKETLKQSGYYLEDLRPFLESITCPTLLVRGEESPFLSREEAKDMLRRMRKAQLAEIPSATHLPVQENLSAFMEALRLFLHPIKFGGIS